MSQTFNKPAIERLHEFLSGKAKLDKIIRLSQDASTREYFRITWGDSTRIACVYPELFDHTHPQIDVTNLFLKCDLPVARIYEVSYEHGVIIQEDFGNRMLRDVLSSTDVQNRDNLLDQAISLIAKIQASTSTAYDSGSIASMLKFDREKLFWELNFFKTHYFESLMKTQLSESTETSLAAEFTELASELETYASVLTHRDFHAANLMVGADDQIKIIDHQDARIGSAAYDLVSLLLDRITGSPSLDWLSEKRLLLISKRENLGLAGITERNLEYEFDLMTVQRCLKAIGTFSNQAANHGKNQYLKYIAPMFQVVLEASKKLERFPNLQNTIGIIQKKQA